MLRGRFIDLNVYIKKEGLKSIIYGSFLRNQKKNKLNPKASRKNEIAKINKIENKTRKKINEKLKAGSQKRSIKLINFQPDSSGKKREKTHIINIRNERGATITEYKDIKKNNNEVL